eukprot:4862786-Pleurochrysis_carterae.AAC.6
MRPFSAFKSKGALINTFNFPGPYLHASAICKTKYQRFPVVAIAQANQRSDPSRFDPGYRYCNLCNKSFSANNFTSQHLKNKHKPAAPATPVAQQLTQISPNSPNGAATNGVRLTWRPPTGGETRLRICTYRIQIAELVNERTAKLVGEAFSTGSAETVFTMQVATPQSGQSYCVTRFVCTSRRLDSPLLHIVHSVCTYSEFAI